MTCPSCGRKLNILDLGRKRCVQCDRAFDRSKLGLISTSSVRVAAGKADAIYHSLDELPPDLRRQLRKAIAGPNAETIVIADEHGREQIFQILQSLPPEAQKKALAALRAAEPPPPPTPALRFWRALLLFSGLGCLALLLWWVWR
jgi:hypothetical protein